MNRLLFALSMFGTLSTAVACDNADNIAGCDVSEVSDVPAAAKQREINGDGRTDAYVSDFETGSAVFIDCGNGKSATVVSGTASIIPKRSPQPGVWGDILIADSDGGFLRVGDDRYRVATLPFQFDAPDDIRLIHDGTRYGMDVPRCEALDLKSPLYQIPDFANGLNGAARKLIAKFGGKTIPIELRRQDSYFVDPPEKIKSINGDAIDDVLIRYRDRSGSGRLIHVAVMLGCGDDDYVLSGILEAGHADGDSKIERVEGNLLTVQIGSSYAVYEVARGTFDMVPVSARVRAEVLEKHGKD